MSAAHTPGPWVVIPRGESSGRDVGTVEPKPELMMGVNYWTVASVNGLRAEWEGNLRLISAAPELLNALQYIVGCSAPMTPQQEQCWPVLRAAIAKATGAQHE